MHIPDGYLGLKTLIGTGAVSAASMAWALRRAKAALDQRLIPMMGIMAAFVFAAQMINFPVLGGTSGHLVGGALAAILMGPAAGIIIIGSVLIIQLLLFADGGVFALAANMFNMAVIGVIVGYGTYRVVCRFIEGKKGIFIGSMMAGWLSTVVAAIFCGLELAVSGAVAPSVVIPAMGLVHMAIGVGEGLITAFAVLFVLNVRPDLVATAKKVRRPFTVREIGIGTGVAVVVAFLLSPFASSFPDGLERVAEKLGFDHMAAASALPSPLTDYTFPGVASPFLKTALAGLIGTAVVFVLAAIIARVAVRKTSREPN